MFSMHIKRTAQNTYIVRQYDDVLSINLGEMNEKKLHTHLAGRDLLDAKPADVLASLQICDEITVKFRTN